MLLSNQLIIFWLLALLIDIPAGGPKLVDEANTG